jgi:2'-hydroxyisoflavone reductase
MFTKRREFIRSAVAAGASLAFAPMVSAFGAKSGSSKSLKVLILGGSGFIGPHMVQASLDRGHEVSIFNRGKTNPHLFPEIEKLVGDRGGDLKALEGRQWDVVIDNSGYVPRHVRNSAQLLKDAAEHYLFTSTAGLYAAVGDGNWPEGRVTEDAPLAELEEPDSEEVGKYYGPLKVVCEQEVQKAFPGRYTISRPGLIVGPGDSTDRFTYYPVRMDRGGEMLAFGTPADPVQYIDARDLANFCLHCVEHRIVNIFNSVGPNGVLTMGEMLNGIRSAIGASTEFTWVPAAFLAESEVGTGSVMPWISPEGAYSGLARMSTKRAFDNGLTFRPLAETARDTLAWWKEQPEDRRMAMRGGLRGGGLEFGPASMDQQMVREAEILAAWKASQG